MSDTAEKARRLIEVLCQATGMEPPQYYDRQGQPMSFDAWVESHKPSSFERHRRVAEGTTPGGQWVSTVWLGLDHAYGRGPPLIFETIVFSSRTGESESLDMERYATEAEALIGHGKMLAKWWDVPAGQTPPEAT